jgi:hypothetical protein
MEAEAHAAGSDRGNLALEAFVGQLNRLARSPAFTAAAIPRATSQAHVDGRHIAPGKPIHQTFIGSFSSKFHAEWRANSDEVRPRRAIGDMAPIAVGNDSLAFPPARAWNAKNSRFSWSESGSG